MNHKGLQDLRDYYSDYHKDVRGFRPHGYVMKRGTEEEIRAAIVALQRWKDSGMGADYKLGRLVLEIKEMDKKIKALKYIRRVMAESHPPKDPPPRAFFHSTLASSAKGILRSKEIRSNHYVSFGEVPLTQFGNVALRFSPTIADQLVKVYYEPRWLRTHKYVAAYMYGPGNHPDDWESLDALVEDVLSLNYENQKEWISWRQSVIRFQPEELESILVTDKRSLEDLESVLANMPEYSHVPVLPWRDWKKQIQRNRRRHI